MTDPGIKLIEIRDNINAVLGDESFVLLDNNDHTSWLACYPLGKITAALKAYSRLMLVPPENLTLYGQWIDIADAIQLSS